MVCKKFLAVLLCFCMLLTFTACSSKKNNDKPQANEDTTNYTTLNLLYCANDTYDPYSLTTKLNAEICMLLYDPLYKCDNNFEPIAVLAESAVQNGNSWTVTLKNVSFSDGSALSANDVLFSLNLAKACARYSYQLSHIVSAEAAGNSVVFNLSINDPYFLNLLSFPVIKAESNTRYNEDKVLLPPIGTGRYILNNNQNALLLNENYFGNKGSITSIRLKNAPNKESVVHYVEVGATDIYYSDAKEGSIVRMTGKKESINSNVLVYLGINDRTGFLSNINLRYAISAALDRSKIVNTAFFGNAVAASGPFHPSWKMTEGYQTSPITAEKQICVENLEKIGYNKLNADGYRVNSADSVLEISLLVNSENASRLSAAELIVSQLKEVGIKVNINALPYEQYKSALENGHFQLYLGEIKVDNNFDISPLVIPGGSCAYGKVIDETQEVTMQTVINEYQSGNSSITNVITAVLSQMPFIPICYRSGVVFYNENISDGISFSESDIFLSIDRLTIAN